MCRCVCVFAHVLLMYMCLCIFAFCVFVLQYCVYAAYAGSRRPTYANEANSQQPASLSLVCLCVCVCTQSIIHAIIDTKQERRSQPASLGILINYNSNNNVAWNVVNTVQKVAKNLFALLRRRWQSTVILFVIRHLNTLLDLVIRLGVVAFALPSGSWF